MSYSGSCLCGSITFQITGQIEQVIHCHCKMCQKSHGAAFASFGLVRQEHFHLAPTAPLACYQSSPYTKRYFCKRCGSNIEWSDNSEFNQGYRSFALGLLDSAYTPEKERHVYENSAPNWCPSKIK